MAQDKLGELEGLYVVSWELVGRESMDGLAEALAGALTEHLQASQAAVFLYDVENDGLRLAAVSGENLNITSDKVYSLATERRSGFHNGHTAKAFKNARTIVVKSIYADVEFLPWEVLAGQDGIIVSVPLVDSEGPVGVYDLFFPTVSSVSPEKIRFFETIGAAAGAAIGHAQMKQGAEPLLRELRAA